ncbi:MAG TPA: adenosylcobinamide-GDP ribazoletransferase [Patescibacteria group bacterium]|nr:adenosylcobinamide-GDP ribazoletransferase [Patescibacteria group bacterium]
MSSFLLSLQFLTIVPLGMKEADEKHLAGAAAYFPFVGLLLGLALAGIGALLGMLNFPALASGVILVVAWVGITGGMHLDGLADTADAFLSARPKEEMLKIMRDPHVGVMGVVSLISLMLLKVSLLVGLGLAPARTTGLLLSCVLSRWSAVLAMFLFPYARQEGKAKVFMEGMEPGIVLFASFTALIFSVAAWGLKGLLAFTVIAGFTCASGRFIANRIGGITGDTLGAVIELTETLALCMVCLG